MTSIKSMVFEEVLLWSFSICIQVQIVNDMEWLNNCAFNSTLNLWKEFG